VSLTFLSVSRRLYTEPSMGASYQISINMANHKQELPMAAMENLHRLTGFRGKDFLEIDQPETRIAYSSHVR